MNPAHTEDTEYPERHASSRVPGPGSPVPTAIAPDPLDRLVVAISSRALFDLSTEHELFERDGLDAYQAYQLANEDAVLRPGIAFPLVQKLLRLNQLRPDTPQVEVLLLSRNSGNSGLRIFNSIEHYGLQIVRAAFTNGAPPHQYIEPFGANLFLSANAEDVRQALVAGYAAASILPSQASANAHPELRIAFDGDAVLFSDEAEQVSHSEGLDRFHESEKALAHQALSGGPFRSVLYALHRIQAAFPAERSPIRTALVTARSAPAHKRVILTLREWGVRIDEALFLGGRDKGPFLAAFGADIFFDDQRKNAENASRFVPTGHVPHGVANKGQ
jgi:5'-nucleotidase